MQKAYYGKKCPICNLRNYGLFQGKDVLLCAECNRKLERSNHRHILYVYNDFFKEILYRYKGLGDLALAPIFLEEFGSTIRKRYKHYVIVLVPSNADDNFRRGFAFLPWIFKSLNMPIISPFSKQITYKQSSSKNREEIKNVIILKNKIDLRNQKLLLVDDVLTSGHTLATCICLLKTLNPKKIDYLVLSAKKENIDKATKLIEGELRK